MDIRGIWRSAWKGSKVASLTGASERRLDAAERAKLLQVVRLGCPRTTAGKYVGLTHEQLEGLLDGDEDLSRAVMRAEADAEVRHMGNVHKAASDEKNWRTSVWWLERHGVVVPEVGEGEAGYPEAVLVALEKFAELIVAEIPDVMRRQSLLSTLLHVTAQSVEPPVVIEAELSGTVVAAAGVTAPVQGEED